VRALVRELRPNIHAKGTDYTSATVPERDVVLDVARVEIVVIQKPFVSRLFVPRLGARRS